MSHEKMEHSYDRVENLILRSTRYISKQELAWLKVCCHKTRSKVTSNQEQFSTIYRKLENFNKHEEIGELLITNF